MSITVETDFITTSEIPKVPVSLEHSCSFIPVQWINTKPHGSSDALTTPFTSTKVSKTFYDTMTETTLRTTEKLQQD